MSIKAVNHLTKPQNPHASQQPKQQKHQGPEGQAEDKPEAHPLEDPEGQQRGSANSEELARDYAAQHAGRPEAQGGGAGRLSRADQGWHAEGG